jgi:hypothetical protein
VRREKLKERGQCRSKPPHCAGVSIKLNRDRCGTLSRKKKANLFISPERSTWSFGATLILLFIQSIQFILSKKFEVSEVLVSLLAPHSFSDGG